MGSNPTCGEHEHKYLSREMEYIFCSVVVVNSLIRDLVGVLSGLFIFVMVMISGSQVSTTRAYILEIVFRFFAIS